MISYFFHQIKGRVATASGVDQAAASNRQAVGKQLFRSNKLVIDLIQSRWVPVKKRPGTTERGRTPKMKIPGTSPDLDSRSTAYENDGGGQVLRPYDRLTTV